MVFNKGIDMVRDITNVRFGKLRAIKNTGKRHSNIGYIWMCECDCGNIIEVPRKYLVDGGTKSCGCLHDMLAVERLTQDIVAGTKMSQLKPQKPQVNNKSGVTGVNWDSTNKKWKASITFQKKRYSLYTGDDKNKAIAARKQAEKQLYSEFFEWYENKHKK